MKKMLTMLLVLAALSSYSDTQDRVAEMRKGYRKEARSHVLDIRKEYQAKLEQALKKAKRFNHEEDIAFLTEELEALKDPAYMLQEDGMDVRLLKGEWAMVFEGSHRCTYVIDRFGKIKIEGSYHFETEKHFVEGFVSRLEYNPETQEWEARVKRGDGGFAYRSLKLQDGFLTAKRWDGKVFKYPGKCQTGKGTCIK